VGRGEGNSGVAAGELLFHRYTDPQSAGGSFHRGEDDNHTLWDFTSTRRQGQTPV